LDGRTVIEILFDPTDRRKRLSAKVFQRDGCFTATPVQRRAA